MKSKETLVENLSKEYSSEHISQITDTTKTEMLEALSDSYSSFKRVELFATFMDKFWVEATLSLAATIFSISSLSVPADVLFALLSSAYLLYEGKKIWLASSQIWKILWYQAKDVLVGFIPVMGDVADYFYKSNVYASNVFDQHLNTLYNKALEMWISHEEILALREKDSKFKKKMDNYLKKMNKSKKK